MVPSGPFTEICTGVMFTSTPLGTGMGFFAMRDMAVSSGDDAEDFAADAGGARLAVGHHAARGRNDRHAQAVHDLGQAVAVLVDAQARAWRCARGARSPAGRRSTSGRCAAPSWRRLRAPRSPRRSPRPSAPGRWKSSVSSTACSPPRARPSGHCGCGSACRRSDRSCSSRTPYQLALITPGTSPCIASSRSLMRPRPNLRYTPRGRPVSAQRLRSREPATRRAAAAAAWRARHRGPRRRPSRRGSPRTARRASP